MPRTALSQAPAVKASYALFDTAIGRCALSWTGRGISALQLPEGSQEETLKAILRRAGCCRPGSPPAWVNEAIEDLRRHLGGQATDLSGIPLDLTGVQPFHSKVYQAARRIKAGETMSYGQLAETIGSPGAARAVGQALGRNPVAIIVPCHRVVSKDGKPTGFSAFGGCATKIRLLAIEGIVLESAGKQDKRQKPSAGVKSPAGLRFEPAGSQSCPFDADEAVSLLCRSDRRLAKLIARVGPLRLELDELLSPFEALAESIVYQQLTGKAAATIFSRLKALFGADRLPDPQIILAAPEDRLRSAGLSQAKVAALRDLASRQSQGEIPSLADLQAMSNEEILEQLTRVRGVGCWTVEMFLIFRLGRPDVLPLNDLGVKKGFARAFGKSELPTAAELEQHGRRWRPYRTAATWYLWRAAELDSPRKTKVKQ